MSVYLQVAEDEDEEPMELPTADDGTLLLSTLEGVFPGTCGLKYLNPESKAMCNIEVVEGQLVAPESGWGDCVYYCVFPKEEENIALSMSVRVAEDEHEEPIEIPFEEDSTLLLSTLAAQFPGTTGLKYRNPESKAMRVVRLVEGRLHPPDTDWGNGVYYCVFPKGKKRSEAEKRKADDRQENSSFKSKRLEYAGPTSNLIVLGLPWRTTSQQLREHFETFGEVLTAQVKSDHKTGLSRGFGIIRFANYKSQVRVLARKHQIDGRWADVRIAPAFRQVPSKMFVGHCTEDMSKEDLREYFSTYGEVADVFIPSPFRSFAFVTFVDPEIPQCLFEKEHVIKGVSVYISNAAPKSYNNRSSYGYGSHRM